MPRKNMSRYVILGLLDMRPMTGYDIKRIVEFSFSDIWSESYGNIYPTLRKFLDEGLAGKHVEKQEGRPDRIVYHITSQGREELIQWLKKPYRKRHVRDEFLMKLLFGYLLPVEENVRMIESFQQSVQERTGWYRESMDELKKGGLNKQSDMLEYLALLQGLLVRNALFRWCEEAVKTLQAFQAKS